MNGNYCEDFFLRAFIQKLIFLKCSFSLKAKKMGRRRKNNPRKLIMLYLRVVWWWCCFNIQSLLWKLFEFWFCHFLSFNTFLLLINLLLITCETKIYTFLYFATPKMQIKTFFWGWKRNLLQIFNFLIFKHFCYLQWIRLYWKIMWGFFNKKYWFFFLTALLCRQHTAWIFTLIAHASLLKIF